MWDVRRLLLILVALPSAGALRGAERGERPPLEVRGISLVALGRHGYDQRGHKLPRAPVRVIPYAGTFKLTLHVERIAAGHTIKWVAWFANVVGQGYTETDDPKVYRTTKGRGAPKTTALTSIVGFHDALLGEPVRATPKPGMDVTPTPGKPGAAYSFHVAARGHNAAYYPLWMRPVREGANVLYATVHQRFVYHLMFRLRKSDYARYDWRAHCKSKKVARMELPYTILLVEDDGERKRLIAAYGGKVVVNEFPPELLQRGAGVTVEKITTAPRLIWPHASKPHPEP